MYVCEVKCVGHGPCKTTYKNTLYTGERLWPGCRHENPVFYHPAVSINRGPFRGCPC